MLVAMVRRRILVCLAGLALAASCSTNSGLPQDRADRFAGDTVFNIGGQDGADPAVQAIVHQLCDGREYDFTPVGFQIQPFDPTHPELARTELGHADPRFAGGNGQILFADPGINTLGSVQFTVASNDAAVSNITLACAFDIRQAQNAINTPGVSFAVNWKIQFQYTGQPVKAAADQRLRGVDFRST
jgi:hypothetical protein